MFFINLLDLGVLLCHIVRFITFLLSDYIILENEVLKSPTIFVELFFLQFCEFYFTCFSGLLLSAQVFVMYSSCIESFINM